MSYQNKINKVYLRAAAAGDFVGLDKALIAVGGITFWNSEERKAAQIAARDGDGRTALMLAAQNKHQTMIPYLAKKGVQTDAADKENRSALHYACMSGHADVVAEVLQLKLAIEQADTAGMTPLLFAIESGNLAAVQILLDAGANIQKADNEGMTPLHHAVYNLDTGIAKLLIARSANPNCQDKYGRTPLLAAVFRQNSTRVPNDLITALLEAGTDTSICNNEGRHLNDVGYIGKVQQKLSQQKGETPSAPTQQGTVECIVETVTEPVATEEGQRNKSGVSSRLREAFENEGLDPDADEHWRAIGSGAIEHIIGSSDSPRVLSTTFNFVSRQCVSVSRNMLTAAETGARTEVMDTYGNPDYVAQAHQKLIDAGKTPPALGNIGGKAIVAKKQIGL